MSRQRTPIESRQSIYRFVEGSLCREPSRCSTGFCVIPLSFEKINITPCYTPESDGTAQPVQSQGESRCLDQTTLSLSIKPE